MTTTEGFVLDCGSAGLVLPRRARQLPAIRPGCARHNRRRRSLPVVLEVANAPGFPQRCRSSRPSRRERRVSEMPGYSATAYIASFSVQSWSAVACHRFGPAEQAGHPGNPFSEATVLARPKRWQATALQDRFSAGWRTEDEITISRAANANVRAQSAWVSQARPHTNKL